jgi:hypothetical protein
MSLADQMVVLAERALPSALRLWPATDELPLLFSSGM